MQWWLYIYLCKVYSNNLNTYIQNIAYHKQWQNCTCKLRNQNFFLFCCMLLFSTWNSGMNIIDNEYQHLALLRTWIRLYRHVMIFMNLHVVVGKRRSTLTMIKQALQSLAHCVKISTENFEVRFCIHTFSDWLSIAVKCLLNCFH